MSLAQSLELKEKLAEALTAAGFEDTITTLDPLEAPPVVSAGGSVLLISPPALDFTTWTATEGTWEVLIITGPRQDRLTAWRRLDSITAAITTVDTLTATKAEPVTYAMPKGDEYPAYVVTITDTF